MEYVYGFIYIVIKLYFFMAWFWMKLNYNNFLFNFLMLIDSF